MIGAILPLLTLVCAVPPFFQLLNFSPLQSAEMHGYCCLLMICRLKQAGKVCVQGALVEPLQQLEQSHSCPVISRLACALPATSSSMPPPSS